eukprot:CAMPEP_0169188450 /NCGR_PEP_ID=MMETSP1016-20121227/3467_1 /TAXON_ID=342587 /ORGANISM="Karlodinium micrum, Strain CCMP2283" /LENGTH=220 /DNA_ID=CAMNT_0009264483 /DNA_START=60 /DNA_END=722 /DNA_ORIENTATION=-
MVSSAPEHVRKSHCRYWWALLPCYMILSILRWYAENFFGSIVMIIMSVWMFYMILNKLKNMTQFGLLVFGTITAVEFFAASFHLAMNIPGRIDSKWTGYSVSVGNNQTTIYAESLHRHNLFDGSMGSYYNIQSAVWVAIPVVELLALLLCYWTYSAFENIASDVEVGDDNNLLDQSLLSDAQGGQGGLYGSLAEGPGSGGGGRATSDSSLRVFEGSENRL